MKKLFARYFSDYSYQEGGATAVEYALIATGIAVTIAVAVYALGDIMLAMYGEVRASFGS